MNLTLLLQGDGKKPAAPEQPVGPHRERTDANNTRTQYSATFCRADTAWKEKIRISQHSNQYPRACVCVRLKKVWSREALEGQWY